MAPGDTARPTTLDAPPEVDPALRRRLVWMLGSLTAFGPLSIDLYLPSFSRLAEVFSSNEAQVQLTLSAYMVGMALGQLLYGPAIDRYGRRGPLIVGVCVYIVASFGCAIAGSIEALMAWRVVQAIGGAAGTVCSRAVVRDLFGPRDGARMLSALLLVMGAAPILAPIIGAQLLVLGDWYLSFVFLGLFGIACLYMVYRLMPETLPERSRTGSVAIGEVLKSYWRLLFHRQLLGFGLGSGFCFAGLFAYLGGVPLVMMEVYGVSPQRFGFLFAINASGFILASQVNRLLLRRYSPHEILPRANTLYLVTAAMMLLVAITELGGLPGLMVPMYLMLFSLGLMAPNATVMALEPFQKNAGAASAVTGTLQLGAGAVSGTLVGVLANGTAVPLAGMIVFFGILAAFALRIGKRARELALAPRP